MAVLKHFFLTSIETLPKPQHENEARKAAQHTSEETTTLSKPSHNRGQ